jgi:hypothetical protein
MKPANGHPQLQELQPLAQPRQPDASGGERRTAALLGEDLPFHVAEFQRPTTGLAVFSIFQCAGAAAVQENAVAVGADRLADKLGLHLSPHITH